jgi:serine/threonine-protein kinase
MVSNELGACEWFVWDIRKSGLIDRGQLDQVISDFLKRNPRAEPPALAEFLVSQGLLSPFQAERILTGKTQGLVLGPYVLVDSIGSGSMGQVYKASSKTDNQWYAVKVLPRRSMWNVRLARRQVRAFSQFSHAGVVPFVDVGTSGGLHYLVWPFVEGESLEARVLRDGRLPPNQVARIGQQLGQALAICHQNGVFHGLIKPSNIMIGADGQARLLDFGIGSLLAENEGESLVDTMSTANTLTSGLDCSSPESIMEPTNRTPAGDQYSLGCTLYFALAGRYPFADGTAVEKMMAHQFKPAPSLREAVTGIPEGIAQVIERLMQKAPEARYRGVDELVEAIQPFAAEFAPRTRSGFGGTPKADSGMSFPSVAPAATTRSVPETPRARTPLPGPGGIPLPPRPKTTTMPAVSSSAPATTPASPIPAAQPPARAKSQAVKPVIPTRQTMQALPETESAPAPTVPVPKIPSAPAPAKRGQPPGWVAEERSRTTFGPLLIILMAALITVTVFLLGKNFMFKNM